MCKLKIQRNEGCKHMTCKCCGYNWCWECGQDWYSYHCVKGAQDPGTWSYHDDLPHSAISGTETWKSVLFMLAGICTFFCIPWVLFYSLPVAAAAATFGNLGAQVKEIGWGVIFYVPFSFLGTM